MPHRVLSRSKSTSRLDAGGGRGTDPHRSSGLGGGGAGRVSSARNHGVGGNGVFGLEQRQLQQMVSEVRHCRDYARIDQMQRMRHEFDLANSRRVLRRRDGPDARESRTRPWYSQGNSLYAARPPTNVDIALGLNGFHNAIAGQGRERVPSTLKPLDQKVPYEMPARPSKQEEQAKWDGIRQEVEQNRKREDDERRNFVYEAEMKRLEQESEMMREERSRQLHKAMPRDWDHQVEFKRRQEEADREAEAVEAVENLKVNSREEERTVEAARQKEIYWQQTKREDREGRERQRMAEEAAIRRQHAEEFARGSTEAEQERREAEEARAEEKRKGERVGEEQRAQIWTNSVRRQEEAVKEFKDKEFENEVNGGVLAASASHFDSARRNLNSSQHDYAGEHLRQLDRARRNEVRFEEAHAAERTRQTRQQGFDRAEAEAADARRKGAEVGAGQLQQIRGKQDREERERRDREREQEERLLEEETYKSRLRADRERAQRDRQAYKEFLVSQMRESDERRLAAERAEAARLEDLRLRSNARDNEEKRRTDRINVNESHFVVG